MEAQSQLWDRQIYAQDENSATNPKRDEFEMFRKKEPDAVAGTWVKDGVSASVSPLSSGCTLAMQSLIMQLGSLPFISKATRSGS